MKIDVIIPVYKPGAELFTLLDRLEKQTVPVQKIILMNTEKCVIKDDKPEIGRKEAAVQAEGNPCQGGGFPSGGCPEGEAARKDVKSNWARLTDGVNFLEKYPNAEVHHISKDEFDHGGTRHQGVQYSDADIFVLMTQDAMPVDSTLVERLTAHLGGKVASAYARQLPGEGSSEFERASRAFNYPETSRYKSLDDLETLGIKTFFCSNVCAAYRRDVYEELGGFISHAIFNEDMIYAAAVVKAGYAISYEAQAQVLHAHNYTNLQQLRRNFDLGVSQADHPEVFGAVASESEGKKLVTETWRYLKERNRLYRFPGFCVQCAFKYTGYLLGKHYKRLPHSLVRKITTNKEYWNAL